MSPRNPLPPSDRCRFRAAQSAVENSAFHGTSEELARLHPLLRAVIGAITGDRIETTTEHDGDGRIIFVRIKRTQRHHSPRSIQSLLASARALLQLEITRAELHRLNGDGRPAPRAPKGELS